MASIDFSAPLRQGLPLIHKKQFWTSLDDMFRAWKSEDAFIFNRSAPTLAQMEQKHNEAGTLLASLSEIQIEVGKNINSSGNKLMLGWVGSSRFEMAILLIFCLIMQAMIFTSGASLPRVPQKSHWN